MCQREPSPVAEMCQREPSPVAHREYNKALWQELEKGKMLRGVKRSDHQCGGKDQIYGSG